MVTMEMYILGPVAVRSNDRFVQLPAGHGSLLLAVLALHYGEPVSRDRLIEATWGGNAPATAVTQLQGLISTLRRALPHDVIETVGNGYRLRIDPNDLDFAVFQTATALARQAVRDGDRVAGSAHYRRGLDAWRGSAFEGLDSTYLAAQATRLQQLRAAVIEEWAALELSLDRPRAIVDEIADLLETDPLRESACALLMLGLYRVGRQADALTAFRGIRRALSEMLGIEPGTELQDLHRRILAADPRLMPETVDLQTQPGSGSAPWPASMRLAQVPADVADFTGRDALVKHITDLLPDTASASSSAPVVCLISGVAGVGKTTLAIHVAHLLRDRFPDGQVYVDMHAASGRPLTAGQVAAKVLRDFGMRDDAIPADEQDCLAIYRSALAYRRVLIVLDDVRGGAYVRQVLPASGASAVLMTSRNRVVDVPGLVRLELDVMDRAEAEAMFAGIVGADRATAEQEAVAAILESCGHLPLAIRIAASRLATRPHWTVKILADRLTEASKRLDELRLDDQQARSAFEIGYQGLPDDQARAFRRLALADVGEISTSVAALLLDLDDEAAERLAESLVDMSLLDLVAPGRYRYHELLRLFAREKAKQIDPSGERVQALSRLLRRYHDTTRAAQVAYRARSMTDESRSLFADVGQARAWLDQEYRNVILTIVQCSKLDNSDPTLLAETLDQIHWYLEAAGYWSCWSGVAEDVLDAAIRVGDQSAESNMRRHLARIGALHGGQTAQGEPVTCEAPDMTDAEKLAYPAR